MRTSTRIDSLQEQQARNRYFTEEASYWEEIYQRQGVKDFVHQQRLRLTLDMIDRTCLPVGSRILDVGCGAGMAATALAEKHYIVNAIDPVQAMVDLTCARAKNRGVEDRVLSGLGDVCSLPFTDNTFAIVISLGVLPWLASINEPLNEIHRVLKPDGFAILTVDNMWALRWFLDPLTNPLFRPAGEFAKSLFRRLSHREPRARWHSVSCAKFDMALKSARLDKVYSTTLGFGPFTCFYRELLPRRAGLKLHRAMQYLSDRSLPMLRRSGSHYLVLATKRAETSLE